MRTATQYITKEIKSNAGTSRGFCILKLGKPNFDKLH